MTADEIIRRHHVVVTGEGTQPMLFAHGFGCDQNMWRFVAPAFAGRYKVVTFDYVGSGQSDAAAYDPHRYASLNGYAQDVLEICEALDLHDVVFVGHSVSAMVGILAANREPQRFAKLILIGPSPRYVNDADYVGGFERADLEGLMELMDKNYIGWAKFLAPVVMKNPEHPELAAELEESFCSTDPVIARKFAEVTFFSDNRADLGRVEVPALVMQCADDAIAPEAVGEYVHSHLRGSVLRKMQATGHCPHVSHPAETIAAINDYLG